LDVLAHLFQIDNLRLAIPHIIEPLYLPPNPATFKLYAQGARSSQSGIESVRTEWKAPETQRIYNYTHKSFAANKDLSASTAIAAHGWIERDRKERESKKGTAIESSEVCGPTLTGEDVTRVVEEFTTNNTIKLELKDDDCTISVSHDTTKTKLLLLTAKADPIPRHGQHAETPRQHRTRSNRRAQTECRVSGLDRTVSEHHKIDQDAATSKRLEVSIGGFERCFDWDVLRITGYDCCVQDREGTVVCQMWTVDEREHDDAHRQTK
jgi:hypothetical protein